MDPSVSYRALRAGLDDQATEWKAPIGAARTLLDLLNHRREQAARDRR